MANATLLARSELRSLVTRAARGAGLDWGLAEEAGWAADWLAARGLPAADWALLWLDRVGQGLPNPVAIGVALSDGVVLPATPNAKQPLPDDLPAPGYLLPFLHLIAARHGAVEIISPTGRVVTLDAAGQPDFGPGWSSNSAGWSVCVAQERVRPARPAVEPAVIAALEAFALNLTVPATSTSRQDAGATGSDND